MRRRIQRSLELVSQSLRRSESKPDLDLFRQVSALIPFKPPKSLPHTTRIGVVDDVNVYIVDGDWVRRQFCMDYVFGGHDLVYGAGNKAHPELTFIPDKQIWIDGRMESYEQTMTLFHEIFERRQMEKGVSYGKAHAAANRAERALRQHLARQKARA